MDTKISRGNNLLIQESISLKIGLKLCNERKNKKIKLKLK